jgi:predicted HTH transcriptional regulator
MYKMTASNFSQNEAREVFYKLKNNSLRNIKNILKNIHIGMRLEGLRRVDVPEIDKEAFREAIINAFCHRDYYEYDSVNIAVFKDRVEVRSPGLL